MADPTLLQAMDIIDKGTGSIHLLKSTFGKNSINRMAKNSMLQTPVIGDASIDKQTLTLLTKAIERRTAAILMSVFTLQPYISLKKFGSIGNYIRSIYDNDKSPIALPSTESAIDNDELSVSVSGGEVLAPSTFKVDPQIEFECLIGTESALNMTDINNVYNEAHTNLNRMQIALTALEAGSSGTPSPNTSIGGSNPNAYTQSLVNAGGKLSAPLQTVAQVHGAIADNNLHANVTPKKAQRTSVGTIKVDSSQGSFDPTLISVTFTVDHGGKDGAAHSSQQTVAIGIQSVLRTLNFEDMIDTMTLAAKGSVEAFKMVRYLTGERKFFDFLLGIADAKEIARPKTIGEKLLANLKRRKKDNKFKMATGGIKPLPITWLIISQAVVDEVLQRTGINLGEPYFAAKLMNEYYFLGFVIVDESLDTAKIIMDGDNTFQETTLRAISNSNKQKLDLADEKVVKALLSGRL